jgi:rhodanese-related sulfurtransferase
LIIDVILLAVILYLVLWPIYLKSKAKKLSKFVDNAEFQAAIPNGQLVDIREAADFRKGHILGARNLPASTLDQSLSALNKSQPILIYEAAKPLQSIRVVEKLAKAGYSDILVLKTGIKDWTGKIKR